MSDKRLLVIDDDEPILRLISGIGEACGMSVEATSVPKEFLKTLESSPPDVVVLDLVMPKFDGIEVLKRMNEKQVGAKIILISGADQSLLDRASKLAEAWGLNVHAAFTKPLDPVLIETAFREAIET
jgi:CheY-like chemotaxis protein